MHSEAKTSYALSISMPSSPSGLHIAQTKKIPLYDDGKLQGPPTPAGTLRSTCLTDHRFDSFKTWSGRLERQISNLRGMPREPADLEAGASEITKAEHIPDVDRYFDALEGPELDTLRVLHAQCFNFFTTNIIVVSKQTRTLTC